MCQTNRLIAPSGAPFFRLAGAKIAVIFHHSKYFYNFFSINIIFTLQTGYYWQSKVAKQGIDIPKTRSYQQSFCLNYDH